MNIILALIATIALAMLCLALYACIAMAGIQSEIERERGE